MIRGHSLALVLVMLVALSTLGAIVASRVIEAHVAAEHAEEELTVRWLARTAAMRAVPGRTRATAVEGPPITVDVNVARSGALRHVRVIAAGSAGTVHLEATLDASGTPLAWHERFSR